jgi:phosphoribosylanthranilate isomerase
MPGKRAYQTGQWGEGMVKVKICGITTCEDARRAVGEGADALGFIFAPSKRAIAPDSVREIIETLPLFVIKVGVFVNEKISAIRAVARMCRLDVIQFHGNESPDLVERFFPHSIKAVSMRSEGSLEIISRYRAGAMLLDAYDPDQRGGTGKSFNWAWAKEAKNMGIPIILSGGLNPDNVCEAIRIVEPYAVDVSTGVESSPGRKDPAKVRDFIRRAKSV